MPSVSGTPAEPWQHEIHERLLQGDPVAPAEAAEALLEPLVRRLRRKYPGLADPQLVDEAVATALMTYLRQPARFDPVRATLFHFLLLAADRDLLIARAGRGLVFVDNNDPEDEQRFSLAHEVAHFLRDYLGPRERALDALGEAVLEVLDGRRLPSPAERLSGLLAHVELGVYRHLLDRSPAGDVVGIDVRDHEDEADRIAIELLAPLPIVVARFAASGVSWSSEAARKTMEELLARDFGLPRPVADRYSRVLVAARRADRSIREWLGVGAS